MNGDNNSNGGGALWLWAGGLLLCGLVLFFTKSGLTPLGIVLVFASVILVYKILTREDKK